MTSNRVSPLIGTERREFLLIAIVSDLDTVTVPDVRPALKLPGSTGLQVLVKMLESLVSEPQKDTEKTEKQMIFNAPSWGFFNHEWHELHESGNEYTGHRELIGRFVATPVRQ